ncbi:hypothetical protein, partial [Microbacterium sp. cx-55]|uniref:hypothetical protein n=1 Tax=Microbacterium sp. cx-55 TaxID=2875948 RepID=UPI001CBC2D24
AAGALIFWLALRLKFATHRRVLPFTAPDAYNATLRGIAWLSVSRRPDPVSRSQRDARVR